MNIQEVPIKTTRNYLNKMSKSIPDKMWFLWQIDELEEHPVCYLDFGCADGSLIDAIQYVMGQENNIFLGYDVMASFCLRAQKKNIPNSFFSVNMKEIFERALNYQMLGYKVVLILSSVLHEIQSYTSVTDLIEIYQRLYQSGFDYIAIRDMGILDAIEPRMLPTQTRSKAAKLLKQVKDPDSPYNSQYLSFGSRWGGFLRHKNYIHWMLKYPYQENWDRELNENYLVNIDALNKRIMDTKLYDNTHWEHYTLPHIKKRVKKDFSLDFDEPTHIKLLYSLK